MGDPTVFNTGLGGPDWRTRRTITKAVSEQSVPPKEEGYCKLNHYSVARLTGPLLSDRSTIPKADSEQLGFPKEDANLSRCVRILHGHMDGI